MNRRRALAAPLALALPSAAVASTPLGAALLAALDAA
jgi:hypothetical protein